MLQKVSEQVAECLRRAAEADARAEAANDSEYRRLADGWRTLARSYEFQGSLGRFISFNKDREKASRSIPPQAVKAYGPLNSKVIPIFWIGLLASVSASDRIPLLPWVLPSQP